MLTRNVGITELETLKKESSTMKQLFPFRDTLTEAREQVKNTVTRQKPLENVMFIIKKRQIIGVLEVEERSRNFLIKNFLIHEDLLYTKGISFWIDFFIKLGKEKRKKTIEITLLAYNQTIIETMLDLHFSMSQEKNIVHLKKNLIYRTALVLAGGGARGAYQIGVWKALKELQLPFSIICGTSVGALNGSLILQDDIEVAEKMWDEIDTGKILSFPTPKDQSVSAKNLMKTIQNFARTAIGSLGVSTKPLQKLIHQLLDPSRMFTSELELYLVTTQVPSFKEVTVSLKECSEEEFPQWLLATSSFFPAMQATKIKGEYYVDGGYKNNIPVDIALKAGATEIIIIDVKGPGFTKPIRIPDNVLSMTISSPWSLGTVLLFDGKRSSWNIQLGYLETLKAFGKYDGYWYTFKKDKLVAELEALKIELTRKLAQETFSLIVDTRKTKEIARKIRKLIKDRVPFENEFLVLLEYIGKIMEVSPTRVYTIGDFISEIKEKFSQDSLTDSFLEKTMLLSLSEWGKKYIEQVPFLSEKQQVLFLYQRLLSEESIGKDTLEFLLNTMPVVYSATVLLVGIERLEKKEDGLNGTRI